MTTHHQYQQASRRSRDHGPTANPGQGAISTEYTNATVLSCIGTLANGTVCFYGTLGAAMLRRGQMGKRHLIPYDTNGANSTHGIYGTV